MFEQLYRLIHDAIVSALPEAQVYVLDPMRDGAHLQAIVIAEQFNSISLAQQHKKVMTAVTELLETQVHALSIKTFTPEKWQGAKEKYGI